MTMEINISYMGASVEFTRQLHSNQTIQERVDALAGTEVSFIKDGRAVNLTLSNEYVEFRNDVNELLEKDMNVLRANPDDIFSYRPNDQWLVFSQFLYDESFFAFASIKEMNQTEAILQNITAGLDSLTLRGINFGGDTPKTQLDSYEAQLELSSSVSALSYFSEKFLSGDIKKGFDALIGDYAEHNLKRLENYKLIEERFIEGRAKLFSERPMLYSVERTPERAQSLSITNKLGKTEYTKEEVAAITQQYTEMFEKMKEQGDSSILKDIHEKLLEYVLKGIPKNDSDYAAAKTFVDARAEDTFNRIENYWKALL